MSWVRGCIAWSLTIAATGCYYYEPVETLAPQPGTYMQVALTDSGTSHFWGYLGPDVGNVRGRVINTDPQSLAISVESVEQRHGQVLTWKGETVKLSREYVATMRERHLSKVRTAMLAGGSVLGFVLGVTAVTSVSGGSGGGSGGQPR
jgi:hypothetical protein